MVPWTYPKSNSNYDDAYRLMSKRGAKIGSRKRPRIDRSVSRKDNRKYIMFKCNDCSHTFFKKFLPSPNEQYVQHLCINRKISTRRLEVKAKSCIIIQHTESSCIELVHKSNIK